MALRWYFILVSITPFLCLSLSGTALSSSCITGWTKVGEHPTGVSGTQARFDPVVGTRLNPFHDMQGIVLESILRKLRFQKEDLEWNETRDQEIEKRDQILLAVAAEVLPNLPTPGHRFARLALKKPVLREEETAYNAVIKVVDRAFFNLVYNAKIRAALNKMPGPRRLFGIGVSIDVRRLLSNALENQWNLYTSNLNEGVPPLTQIIPLRNQAAALRLLRTAEMMAGYGTRQDVSSMKDRVIKGFENPLADIASDKGKFGPLHIFGSELSLPKNDSPTALLLYAQKEHPLPEQFHARLNYFIDQYQRINSSARQWDRTILMNVLKRIWPHLLYVARVEKELQGYPKQYAGGHGFYDWDIQRLDSLLKSQLDTMLRHPLERVEGIERKKLDPGLASLLENIDTTLKQPLFETPDSVTPGLEHQPEESKRKEPALITEQVKRVPTILTSLIAIPERKVEEIQTLHTNAGSLYRWGTDLQGDQLTATLNLLRFRRTYEEHLRNVIEPLVTRLEATAKNNAKHSVDVADQTMPFLTEALTFSHQALEQIQEVVQQTRHNQEALVKAVQLLDRQLTRFESKEITYATGSALESTHEALLLRKKALAGTLTNAGEVYLAAKELERQLIDRRSRIDYLCHVFGNLFLYEGAEPEAILAAVQELPQEPPSPKW